jgi:DNA-binding CsgD family transcriptional regulator
VAHLQTCIQTRTMARPGFKPRADVAERRAQILAWRIEQVPYSEIARRLKIPVPTAKSHYQRALQQLQADQAAVANTARALELAKLDLAEQAVWRVLRKRHVTVSNGKLIYLDGAPLEDDAPVLNAVDRLVRIAQRRATLLGMDTPTRVEVSDATDQAIRALAAELAAGMGDMEPGGTPETTGHPAGGEKRTPAP